MAEESSKEPDLKLAPPWEVKLSEQVSGKFGFKDGRVEVTILLPKPFSAIKKSVTLKLTPEEAASLKEALDKAVIWNSLPDYQRERDGAE